MKVSDPGAYDNVMYAVKVSWTSKEEWDEEL